jgi:hypothetical protein
MWTLEPTTTLQRAGSVAGHLAAVALLVWFQEVGQRLRREEPRAWWAGSSRDLINAAGLSAIGAALRLGGWPGPAALLAAGLETLAVFAVTTAAAALLRERVRLAGLAGSAVVCLPALLRPAEVLAGLGALAARLFPAGG